MKGKVSGWQDRPGCRYIAKEAWGKRLDKDCTVADGFVVEACLLSRAVLVDEGPTAPGGAPQAEGGAVRITY